MDTEVVYRSDGLFLEQVRPPSSRHWQLDGDRMAVGRDPSSAVYVNDASVSWHHAELVRRGGLYARLHELQGGLPRA